MNNKNRGPGNADDNTSDKPFPTDHNLMSMSCPYCNKLFSYPSKSQLLNNYYTHIATCKSRDVKQ